MPWSCTQCGTNVERDDAPCPGCDARKESWTMVADATRNLVVSRKRVRLLAGDLAEPRPAGDPALAGAALAPATRAVAVPKAEVLELLEDGLAPAPADVLHVELKRGQGRDVGVTLEVLYAGRGSEELAFPREADPAEEPDPLIVKFLFVFGPERLDGVELDGVYLVDVSEESEEGFAPSVELRALGQRAQELPLEAEPEFEFSV